MKGKRAIAGILLVGILATALAGCKNADVTKKEREKPVITLGSDSYPPYNYLNEDGSMAAQRWILWNDKWYYLNWNGAMAVNTMTPDGYTVGSDGVWNMPGGNHNSK